MNKISSWALFRMTDEERLKHIISRCIWNGDCLEWQGTHNKRKDGRVSYPIIIVKRKHWTGHRLVFLLSKGLERLPSDKMVLHKCDNPKCLNIEHLYLGTAKDNIQDALRNNRLSHQAQTHCKYGHELRSRPDGRGLRICVPCRKRINKERSAARKAERHKNPYVSASGFKGVYKEGNKYGARIKKNKKSIHLGVFNTPEEAHQKYLSAKEAR